MMQNEATKAAKSSSPERDPVGTGRVNSSSRTIGFLLGQWWSSCSQQFATWLSVNICGLALLRLVFLPFVFEPAVGRFVVRGSAAFARARLRVFARAHFRCQCRQKRRLGINWSRIAA